jgi:hypothetical protein
MPPSVRRYLVREHVVGSAVFNLLFNALIAWLLFRGLEDVPLWGQQSIAGDTLATAFMLPFLTTLIVTRLARGHVRGGRVERLAWTRRSHPVLAWLPAALLPRAVVLGVLGVVLVGIPTAWALGALQVDAMAFWPFVGFKALLAAAMAAVVTPVVALWALVEPAPEPAR